ncbi:adenosine kinase [Carboxylicivirga sp. M1479]|uniref:adenosine kinase n=1 Tax=Carboxylicivirga sp. M1479 TaxID=2594476 RepID=UPI0011774257|nr:adenosine kinase [Carboxylicivirga sp. M1479]TRX72416.1 adenosine kinase [Carboxylicivirga sp. M1479]
MSSVLGLGNALVDVLAMLENDQMLQDLGLPKGSMQLVDEAAAQKVKEATSHIKKDLASGGSAANTIHGLASLGIKTGFIGKIGRDELGQVFKNDMTEHNITPHLLESDTQSGHANALISPDSERTFATFLGAAVELSQDDLVDDLFQGYKYFHVEGYLVQNKALIEKAYKMAKANGLITSIDLASFNVVEDNLEFLTNLIHQYVDIVFANEEEAKAYTGKEGEEALQQLAQGTEVAILKLGKDGSMIKRANEVVKVGIIPANSIDTTGAGDLYAAGFLFGLIQNLSLDKCGQIGSILSGHVIEVVGPKMSESTWEEIQKKIKGILN